MSNTTASPNRNINQLMNEENVAGMISKNKNALIAIAIAILVAVVGFGLYSTFSEKSKAEFNTLIFNFESGSLKNYNEKSDPKALVSELASLHKAVGNYSGMVPVVIKSSDVLMSGQHLNEALAVLEMGQKLSKNEYADYFILSRLAVVYEDLNQDQKAIDTLEKMNSKSLKIFEGKNYLDLGRLYLKLGNKEKAKASFTYVVEKAKDEGEFVKIAKLYLSKL